MTTWRLIGFSLCLFSSDIKVSCSLFTEDYLGKKRPVLSTFVAGESRFATSVEQVSLPSCCLNYAVGGPDIIQLILGIISNQERGNWNVLGAQTSIIVLEVRPNGVPPLLKHLLRGVAKRSEGIVVAFYKFAKI